MSLDGVIAENNRLRPKLAEIVSPLGYSFGAGLARDGDGYTICFRVFGDVSEDHKEHIMANLPESAFLDIRVEYDER